MAAMNKIRIGIIGCGGMATSHAQRFGDVLDRIEVTAVVDIVEEHARAVAELLPNDPLVKTDYRDIFDHVDAILVVVPHHLQHTPDAVVLGPGSRLHFPQSFFRGMPLDDTPSFLQWTA